MTWIASAISAVAGLFKLVAAYLSKRRDEMLVSLGRSEQKQIDTESEKQTQEVIKDIADERSSIPDPATDPDDLARELRGYKSGSGSSGRKRPW